MPVILYKASAVADCHGASRVLEPIPEGWMGNRTKRLKMQPKRWWRRLRLDRWQTLLAAAVTAMATIIGAALMMHNPSSSPSASSPPSASPAPIRKPRISIEYWSERPAPPGKEYFFKGTLDPGDFSLSGGAAWGIYVLAQQRPSSHAVAHSSQPWLVSPKATLAADYTWTVKWYLPHPPQGVRWTVVLWLPPVPAPCPRPVTLECARGLDPYYQLKKYGPDHPLATAASTIRPPSKS
jgi:hypothetical protein